MTPAPPPRWETAVLACSFALLWAWFVARQHAYSRPGGHLPIYWNLALLVPFVALVFLTRRRMRRVQQALREQQESQLRGFRPPR